MILAPNPLQTGIVSRGGMGKQGIEPTESRAGHKSACRKFHDIRTDKNALLVFDFRIVVRTE